MLLDIICATFLLLGSLFVLIASIGLLRFPDLLLRMHAATKAGTMGVSLLLLAVIIHFHNIFVSIESIVIILFIFITVPIGSHMIARISYFNRSKICPYIKIDELKDYYQKIKKK